MSCILLSICIFIKLCHITNNNFLKFVKCKHCKGFFDVNIIVIFAPHTNCQHLNSVNMLCNTFNPFTLNAPCLPATSYNIFKFCAKYIKLKHILFFFHNFSLKLGCKYIKNRIKCQ